MTPEPPIPPDCDVSDMPYMPWHVVRFLNSDLVALANPAEGWAALILWNKAWVRTPSGSLPDDDTSLSKMVAYPLSQWRKVRSVALRHWTLCSDGRLYHPLVSEKVLDAWIERLGYRRRSAMGNAKKHLKPFDPTPFDLAIEDAQRRLQNLLARSAEGLLIGSLSAPKVKVKVQEKISSQGESTSTDGSVAATGQVVEFRRAGE